MSSRPGLIFFHGVRDELPLLVGVVPFGMIYGVLAVGSGLPRDMAQLMSSVVFAGSSQFMIVQLLAANTPLVMVVLTAFVINLRHMLYSASIAPYLRHLSRGWKWLLAYLLTDEAYAVSVTHFQRKGSREAYDHLYFLGAGLALWTSWQASTALGIFLGAQIPAKWQLDFALPLTFIALVTPSLKNRAGLVAAITSGLVAVLAFGLPYRLGIILASLAGILAGGWLSRRRQT